MQSNGIKHMSPPPRLLHFHIFKNGGSTLDWILKRNFGEQFREFHGPSSESTLFAPSIAKMLEENPGFSAFSSHHFRFPVEGIDNVVPLSFVRHPLDRVPSIYEQERRAQSDHLDDPVFESLSSWVAHALQHRPMLLCDAQVSFFGRGGIYYEVPSEDCLLDAKDVLDSLEFVGVVSQYEESMALLEHVLRRWWPTFDASYFIQNASARERTLEERLARLARLLEPEVYKALVLNNRYDLNLFEYAQRIQATRSSAIDDFSERVADLRMRCQSLKEN